MPATVVEVVLRVAAVKMPDVPAHIEGARAVTSRIINIRTQKMVESVGLEVPNGTTEETSADEQDEVSHDDKEHGESYKSVVSTVSDTRSQYTY